MIQRKSCALIDAVDIVVVVDCVERDDCCCCDDDVVDYGGDGDGCDDVVNDGCFGGDYCEWAHVAWLLCSRERPQLLSLHDTRRSFVHHQWRANTNNSDSD